jgi:hypothetical protein
MNGRGVNLQAQLDAAQQLQADPTRWREAFDWSCSLPTSGQVREIGRLLFPVIGNSNAARTAEQLGARINILRRLDGDLQRLVANEVAGKKQVDGSLPWTGLTDWTRSSNGSLLSERRPSA